jgi:MFS family permease
MALLGLLLVTQTARPIVALIGFAIIGLGVSNVVPIAFTAAGNVKELSTGDGIATVALIGYFGLLAGPPVIGFLAELLTLRVALLLLALLLVMMILASKWVRRSEP